MTYLKNKEKTYYCFSNAILNIHLPGTASSNISDNYGQTNAHTVGDGQLVIESTLHNYAEVPRITFSNPIIPVQIFAQFLIRMVFMGILQPQYIGISESCPL